MKINPISQKTANQNFGLKIVRDKEFFEFFRYLQRRHGEIKTANLLEDIQNLAFKNDTKESTQIVFGPIKRIKIEEPRYVVPRPFFNPYEPPFENYKNRIDYSFFDAQEKVPASVDMRCNTILDDNGTKNLLAEIASDYARYAYSK